MNASAKGPNEVPFTIIQDYNVITGNNNAIHELLKYPSPPGSTLALNAPAHFVWNTKQPNSFNFHHSIVNHLYYYLNGWSSFSRDYNGNSFT